MCVSKSGYHQQAEPSGVEGFCEGILILLRYAYFKIFEDLFHF